MLSPREVKAAIEDAFRRIVATGKARRDGARHGRERREEGDGHRGGGAGERGASVASS